MTRSRGRPEKVERNDDLVAFRKTGKTFREVGAEFGISHVAARKIYRRRMGIFNACKRRRG